MNHPFLHAFRCVVLIAASANALCAVSVEEAPAPVFDAKVRMTEHPWGAMRWLSDHVLGITTEGPKLTDGKVVAVDLRSREVTPLGDGFLVCSLPAERTVGILRGGPGTVTKTLYQWDDANGRLIGGVQAAVDGGVCGTHFPPSSGPVRHLSEEDGMLQWEEPHGRSGQGPVFLV